MVSLGALGTAATATVKTVEAPVGGWDAFSALADMPKENAVVLDNWIAEPTRVTMRRGHASHATGLGATVETILQYTPEDATGEIFGAAGSNIYDVTSSGPVGSAVVTGLTSAQWQQQQIRTAGGHFLFICNGADSARLYDGVSWSIPSITGPNLSALVWVNLHYRRLFFGETDSLDFWYLDVNSIGGTAKKFSLGGVAKRGGYIVAMGSWTRDAGDGADDIAVFVTSEGEAIVYQGIDPNNQTTWALIGDYTLGQPVGRRSVVQAGGDLVIVTEDGFISVAVQLNRDRSLADINAISRQINPAVTNSARLYGNLPGWEPIIYPRGSLLMFNVPQGATTSHQYVFNTITGKPSRFTGLNAQCWGLLDDQPYFGTLGGTVQLFDTGESDAGANINADAVPAFHDFGSQRKKAFKKVQPVFQSAGAPAPALDMNLDYVVRRTAAVPQTVPSNSLRWGVGRWGVDRWGSSGQTFLGWRDVGGIGRSASLRVRISSNSVRTSWVETNYEYQTGGLL